MVATPAVTVSVPPTESSVRTAVTVTTVATGIPGAGLTAAATARVAETAVTASVTTLTVPTAPVIRTAPANSSGKEGTMNFVQYQGGTAQAKWILSEVEFSVAETTLLTSYNLPNEVVKIALRPAGSLTPTSYWVYWGMKSAAEGPATLAKALPEITTFFAALDKGLGTIRSFSVEVEDTFAGPTGIKAYVFEFLSLNEKGKPSRIYYRVDVATKEVTTFQYDWIEGSH
jgi:hypothetical protein